MGYLIVISLLFVTCNIGWSTCAQNSYGQQQQLLQQDLLQQQIRQLQQQLYFLQQQQSQGETTKATGRSVVLPTGRVYDFEYKPTVQGYRFSYLLPDGTRLEENAFITSLPTENFHSGAKTTDFATAGVGSRPKPNLKNRKLSPNSLRALSG